jgi:hypothetical protein
MHRFDQRPALTGISTFPLDRGFRSAGFTAALTLRRAMLGPGRLLRAVRIYLRSCGQFEALSDQDFRGMPIDRRDIYRLAFHDAIESLNNHASPALAAIGWTLLAAIAAGLVALF